jgi:hypothetical protein
LNYMRLYDHPDGDPHDYWINVSNGKISDIELLVPL